MVEPDEKARRDLATEIAEGKAIAIVGAGVSIAATNIHKCASWRGLLKHGIEFCINYGAPKPNDRWVSAMHALLDANTPGNFLTVADEVAKLLEAPHSGTYGNWLKEGVGSLRVVDSRVLEAIAALGVPIATSNYDGLLEEATGWEPVTWRDEAKMVKVLRCESEGIMHLHGYWERPDTVVFGTQSYAEVLRSEHAQVLQKALAMWNSWIFVGCGEGLVDPNIGELIGWVNEKCVSHEHYHYLLTRSDQAKGRKGRVLGVSYGKDFEDLAGFLSDLGSKTKRVRAGGNKDVKVRVIIPIFNPKRIPSGVTHEEISVRCNSLAITGALATAFKNLREDDHLDVTGLLGRGTLDLYLFREATGSGRLFRFLSHEWLPGVEAKYHHDWLFPIGRAISGWFATVTAVDPPPDNKAHPLCLGPGKASDVSLLCEFLEEPFEEESLPSLVTRVFGSLEEVRQSRKVEAGATIKYCDYYGPLLPALEGRILEIGHKRLVVEVPCLLPTGSDIPMTLIRRGPHICVRWQDLRSGGDIDFCLLREGPMGTGSGLYSYLDKGGAVNVSWRLRLDRRAAGSDAEGIKWPTMLSEIVRHRIVNAATAADLPDGIRDAFAKEASRVCRHVGWDEETALVGFVAGNLRLDSLLIERDGTHHKTAPDFKFLDHAWFEDRSPLLRDHASFEVSVWVDFLLAHVEDLDALNRLFIRMTADTSILHFDVERSGEFRNCRYLRTGALLIRQIRCSAWMLALAQPGTDEWWPCYNRLLYYELLVRLRAADAAREITSANQTGESLLRLAHLLFLVAETLDDEREG